MPENAPISCLGWTVGIGAVPAHAGIRDKSLNLFHRIVMPEYFTTYFFSLLIFLLFITAQIYSQYSKIFDPPSTSLFYKANLPSEIHFLSESRQIPLFFSSLVWIHFFKKYFFLASDHTKFPNYFTSLYGLVYLLLFQQYYSFWRFTFDKVQTNSIYLYYPCLDFLPF